MISYHIISYCIILYHIISYHVILCIMRKRTWRLLSSSTLSLCPSPSASCIFVYDIMIIRMIIISYHLESGPSPGDPTRTPPGNPECQGRGRAYAEWISGEGRSTLACCNSRTRKQTNVQAGFDIMSN